MDNHKPTERRAFLQQVAGIAGAAWLSANWPGIAAAAQHAHEAAHAATPQKLKVLTPEQAREVEAVAAAIIPTDDQPGAREAGVIYFIDYALQTFGADDKKTFEEGLPRLHQLTQKTFPGVKKFSAASPEQQQQLLSQLAGSVHGTGRGLPTGEKTAGDPFFDAVWMYTISGFLVAPDGHGSPDYVGWKVIGRDPAMVFQPPFGYYDKDYPGFQLPQSALTTKNEPAKGTGSE